MRDKGRLEVQEHETLIAGTATSTVYTVSSSVLISKPTELTTPE
jgi:hypothetical protein